MIENTLEQPNFENEDNCISFSAELAEDTSNIQNGSIFGKFKDAKSLLEAYNNLEAEFTRKSQKLAELQKKDECEPQPKYENLDEFLKSTTDSDKYKKEITEIISNENISNLPNKYQVALLIAKEAERKSAENLIDQNYLDKNIYSNENIKQKIISDYLSNLNNIPPAPKVISGNSSNIYFSPNENKPQTIREAGELFSKMLK